VLFYLNEEDREDQLLAIPLEKELLDEALSWTIAQVKALQRTACSFQADPLSVPGGSVDPATGSRTISATLKQQCTTCGRRFDCQSYAEHLGDPAHRDIDIRDVGKN